MAGCCPQRDWLAGVVASASYCLPCSTPLRLDACVTACFLHSQRARGRHRWRGRRERWRRRQQRQHQGSVGQCRTRTAQDGGIETASWTAALRRGKKLHQQQQQPAQQQEWLPREKRRWKQDPLCRQMLQWQSLTTSRAAAGRLKCAERVWRSVAVAVAVAGRWWRCWRRRCADGWIRCWRCSFRLSARRCCVAEWRGRAAACEQGTPAGSAAAYRPLLLMLLLLLLLSLLPLC